MPRSVVICLTALVTFAPASAQPASAQGVRRPSTSGTRTEVVRIECPAPLGSGVKTGRLFCDVLGGTDPSSGAIVRLPPHRGTATLTFDLHNRQMYSEDLERAGRAYTRAEATIGALTLDGTVLQRFSILTEYRRATDLYDRIAGGSGPGGVKAVAPAGIESVTLEVPANVNEVSLLGEQLKTTSADGNTATYTTPGRPVAVVSNVRVQYRPAPAKPARKPARRQ